MTTREAAKMTYSSVTGYPFSNDKAAGYGPEPFLCDRPVNGGASGCCVRPDGHRGKCVGSVDVYLRKIGSK